ncbi:MAG: hypothetical protein O3C49_08250 [Proteobacteria bacterium]|nr:hypothetical protein [Pseudomonadota bacterium]MDA1324513.1 hypothetical protein [Pseudomonadota bacterium]
MVGFRYLSVGVYVAAGAVLLAATAARADAIDGSWCYRGRHLAIEGPKILTPSGKQLTGNYDRHAFIYKVPAGAKGAGTSIFMGVLDDETMELRVGSELAKPEVWHRCAAPVS